MDQGTLLREAAERSNSSLEGQQTLYRALADVFSETLGPVDQAEQGTP